MKNKRAMLLAEETLKIVIAVICIGFLAGFLASLYFGHKGSGDLKFADESLDYLVNGINSEETEVEIYNPKGWSILSWPYDGKIPFSCSNVGWESCICICKTPFFKGTGNFLKNCDKKGLCSENSKNLTVGEDWPIFIDSPPIILEINYESKKIIKK